MATSERWPWPPIPVLSSAAKSRGARRRPPPAGSPKPPLRVNRAPCRLTVIYVLALLGFSSFGFAQLSAADLSRAAEVERLLATHAASVWPGWGPHALLVRKGGHEYLIAHPSPPEGFVPLKDVEIAGSRVHVLTGHLTPGPVATSWPVGGLWSVAVPALDDFQEAIDGILGEGVVLLDDPSYIRAVIHEAFHAFQMNTFGGPGGLPRADEAIGEREVLAALEQRSDLNDRHLQQGLALARALSADTEAEVRQAALQFLQFRASWRAVAPAGTRALERQIEWIEGLARYADTALMSSVGVEEAASASGLEPYPQPEQVREEFLRQLSDPASIPGGLRDRYFVLGAAQGFVLDQLMPDWKARTLPGGEALEDLLAEAAGGSSQGGDDDAISAGGPVAAEGGR